MLPDTLILQAPVMTPTTATTNAANESPTAGNGNGMFSTQTSFSCPLSDQYKRDTKSIVSSPPKRSKGRQHSADWCPKLPTAKDGQTETACVWDLLAVLCSTRASEAS